MEATSLYTPRTLLGRPTPFVGRDAELLALAGLYEECLSARAARAVVLVGPAGVGKSRLRVELISRLSAHARPPKTFVGRGAPDRQSAPFSLLLSALRASNEGRLAAQSKDLAPLRALLGEDEGARKEMHSNARQIAEEIRRALLGWLEAQCQSSPLLFVVEDLHWADAATVSLLDEALLRLRGAPFLLFGLARPEAEGRFPSLWQRHNAELLPLRELSSRACLSFCRSFLAEASDADLTHLAERSQGNPFFLEELIRATAAGEEVSGTVLSLAGARLGALPLAERRLVAAASIFGRVFWGGAVASVSGLLSETGPGALGALVAREIIARRAQSRFGGEPEYVFRHELLRDAAYASLEEEERIRLHRLAGLWLEAAGERDFVVLAQHFERGKEPERSAGFYLKASHSALRALDLEGALSLAERGLRLAEQSPLSLALRALIIRLHRTAGRTHDAYALAKELLREVVVGSDAWRSLLLDLIICAGRLGEYEALRPIAEQLLTVPLGEPPDSRLLYLFGSLALQLQDAGEFALSNTLIEVLEENVGRVVPPDDHLLGELAHVRAWRAVFEGDIWAAAERFEEMVACDKRSGSIQAVISAQINVASCYLELGADSLAERTLEELLAAAAKGQTSPYSFSLVQQNLGLVRERQGRLEEARTLLEESYRAFQEQRVPKHEGHSRAYLARVLGLLGDKEGARREISAALALTETARATYASVLAIQAQLSLLARSPEEALDVAHRAAALLQELGTVEEGEALIRLVYAEALLANQKEEEAKTALLEAKSRILTRADKIKAPKWRQSFLSRVPENAKTLSLAAELLGEEANAP